MGGRLIRRLVGELRAAGLSLPINSHILIALSGGSDSLALAHVLIRYGRRVIDPARITLLHVNHGWRGKESDEDARFIERLGKRWGVTTVVHRLLPPDNALGQSWEEVAREARKRIFEREATERKAWVLTAHQGDDLAETLLWRLFTGTSRTHGGGIAVRHGCEIRPLLRVRKSDLQAYLKEEKQRWREDSTNCSERFLRSKMRARLMPEIERLFPRAIDRLIELGLQAQRARSLEESGELASALGPLFGASGLRTRSAHWRSIGESLRSGRLTAIDLPDGWRLSRELGETAEGDPAAARERWILESSGSLFGD